MIHNRLKNKYMKYGYIQKRTRSIYKHITQTILLNRQSPHVFYSNVKEIFFKEKFQIHRSTDLKKKTHIFNHLHLTSLVINIFLLLYTLF